MKFRKLIATAAAVMCAAAMTVTSSAFITNADTAPTDGYLISQPGMFLVMLYSDGTYDSSEKNVTDYGIDLTKIKTVEVTMQCDVEIGNMGGNVGMFMNDAGGAIVMSSKTATDSSSHNWNVFEWWGVNDDEAGLSAATYSRTATFEKVETGTYKATVTLNESDATAVIPGYDFVQFAVSQYGGIDDITIKSIVMKDASGAEMISFDEKGKASLPLVKADAPAAETDAPAAETEAPAAETEAPAAETEAPAAETAAPAANASKYIEDNVVTFTKDDLAGAEAVKITYSALDDAAIKVGACASTNNWAWTELDFTLPAGDSVTLDIKMSDVLAVLGATDPSELGDATKIYNAGGEAIFESAEVIKAVDAAAEEKPAEQKPAEQKPAETAAPTTGDVSAATNSSKGSPDTGVADVAAVAGLAVAAAGAVVLAKKRK